MSMPFGPSDVLKRPETDRAAMMLCFCAWRPLILLLACCSFRMMKGLPYSSKTMDIFAEGARCGRLVYWMSNSLRRRPRLQRSLARGLVALK